MACRLLRLAAMALILASLVAVPAAGIEVKGRVIEYGSGVPLDGARVAIRCLEGLRQSGKATTDDRGEFRLRLAAQGRCRIEVTKPGYLSSLVFAPIEADLSIVSRVSKGGVVAGRVVNELGTPVPRASVVLLREPSGASFSGRRFAARTDEQGSYRLFGIGPGSYAVGVVSSMDAMPAGTGGRVPAASCPPRTVTITAGGEHANVDFVLPTAGAGSIVGRVDGAPPESAVLLALLPRDMPAAPLARALMDPGGGFRFSGIPAGAYALIAAAPSSGSGGYAGILGANPMFARVELEVVPGSTQEIRIEMQPGETASFQLTGPDNTPASACSQSGTLLLTSLESWGADMNRRAAISASEPLALRGLAPVRYAAGVTGLRAGCFPSSETVIDLTSGAPPVIPLQVSAGSDLRGKIVGSRPSDRGRAGVLVWPSSDGIHDSGMLTLFCDASGHFTADSLQPGHYRLLVVTEEDWSDPQWQPQLSAAIEIQLLRGTTNAEIPMPARSGEPGRSAQSRSGDSCLSAVDRAGISL